MSQNTWLAFLFSVLNRIKSLSHLTWHSLCPAKGEKTRPHEENLNEEKQLLGGAVIELSLSWPHEGPGQEFKLNTWLGRGLQVGSPGFRVKYLDLTTSLHQTALGQGQHTCLKAGETQSRYCNSVHLQRQTAAATPPLGPPSPGCPEELASPPSYASLPRWKGWRWGK